MFQRYSVGDAFRGFCGSCGTLLFNGLASGDGIATLIVSTLDKSPEQGPVMHINLESKADWYVICDDLPQYQTSPADIAATLKALAASSR